MCVVKSKPSSHPEIELKTFFFQNEVLNDEIDNELKEENEQKVDDGELQGEATTDAIELKEDENANDVLIKHEDDQDNENQSTEVDIERSSGDNNNDELTDDKMQVEPSTIIDDENDDDDDVTLVNNHHEIDSAYETNDLNSQNDSSSLVHSAKTQDDNVDYEGEDEVDLETGENVVAKDDEAGDEEKKNEEEKDDNEKDDDEKDDDDDVIMSVEKSTLTGQGTKNDEHVISDDVVAVIGDDEKVTEKTALTENDDEVH